jgi:RNase H-like domain found in reverse transcriptase
VQLLQDAHQRLRPIIQVDKKGFQLQIRTTSGESLEGLFHPAETAHFRTGDSLPKIRSPKCLITDAATGMADTPGGLGAILTQVDQDGNFHAISFASRQLKDHEMNCSPFLLEAAAAVWGVDLFNEYLKGKRFILYTDHKPLEKLGHLHSKMLN